MIEETIANLGAAIFGIAGVLLALVVWHFRKRRGIVGLIPIPLTALGIAALSLWYGHRPIPAPTQEQLFPGVEYVREIRSSPRPLVINVVRVNLTLPGVGFLVTPGTQGEELLAHTVSEFVSEQGVQIAINGGFFEPWWDNGPFDYYPHYHDPVHPIAGTYASRGTVYWQDALTDDVLYISPYNRMSFGAPQGEIYDAITGYQMLLFHGENIVEAIGLYDVEPQPRSAVGMDESGQTLIMMVVDGRQPNYSEGVTLGEMAELMRDFGAYHALNLDGGGSSTLVVEGADGQPRVLNSPIHSRIPGNERPVATHLGVVVRSASGN